MSVPYTPPPHSFNPDDKRAYLLMVFTRTPYVSFAVPDGKGGLKMYPFPKKPGIYALYLCDRALSEILSPNERSGELSEGALKKLNYRIVYVGKTSGGGTLNYRLGIHYRKIDGRQNISVDQIICRYLEIEEEWNVLFAERNLINAAEITTNPPPPWNTNGFGSNVPGRGRPGFRQKHPQHFDVLYPPKPGVKPEPEEESED